MESKEKRMTIVAGFCAADGIVLAGDTMYSGGAKIHQPKLFSYSVALGENPCSLAFALTGNEAYGKMAIEDCVDEVRSAVSEERTIKSVKRALRKTIKRINEEYVDRRPEGERESVRLDLIIAASVPPDGLSLFKTHGAAVVAVRDYHCAGNGWYLGDYFMRNVFVRSMSMPEVVLLAVQAFWAVKSYDGTCGGDTQFLMMLPGGEVTVPVPYDITRLEGHMAEFEKTQPWVALKTG
jgi:20S proteasome alpha/beta subunit